MGELYDMLEAAAGRTQRALDVEESLLRLLRLARVGCDEIFKAQLKAAGK